MFSWIGKVTATWLISFLCILAIFVQLEFKSDPFLFTYKHFWYFVKLGLGFIFNPYINIFKKSNPNPVYIPKYILGKKKIKLLKWNGEASNLFCFFSFHCHNSYFLEKKLFILLQSEDFIIYKKEFGLFSWKISGGVSLYRNIVIIG